MESDGSCLVTFFKSFIVAIFFLDHDGVSFFRIYFLDKWESGNLFSSVAMWGFGDYWPSLNIMPRKSISFWQTYILDSANIIICAWIIFMNYCNNWRCDSASLEKSKMLSIYTSAKCKMGLKILIVAFWKNDGSIYRQRVLSSIGNDGLGCRKQSCAYHPDGTLIAWIQLLNKTLKGIMHYESTEKRL